MNEQFKRQAEDFLKAAKDARIPDNVQAFAEDTVVKSREAFHKISAVTKEHAQTAEELLLATQAGARSIGAKLVDNTMSNAAAVFDAAEAIARAKTLPEATRLQAEFFQKQLAAAGAQTKELFELSTRVAQQTLQTVNEAAGKTMEKVRKSS